MHEQIMSNVKRNVTSLVQSKPALKSFETEITAKVCEIKPLNLLQAELSLHYLCEPQLHSTPKSVRQVFEELSKSPLEIALHRLLDNATPWTLKVISWMVYAFRPLRLGELATAMALTDEMSLDPVDDDFARDIKADLLQTLGSRIRVQNNEVHFVHSFIKEAAQEHIKIQSTGVSHRTIALTCLSYLSTSRLQRVQATLTNFRLNQRLHYRIQTSSQKTTDLHCTQHDFGLSTIN